MRALFMATILVSTGLASPAIARDQSWYAGIEGGVLLVHDNTFRYNDATIAEDDAYRLEHSGGFDIDAIAGFDMGMIRVEGELAYKRAKIDEIRVAPRISFSDQGYFDADGHSSALSAMVNGLVDVGGNTGIGAYAGAGVGFARVRESFDLVPELDRFFRGTDGGFAWQAIAGLRVPVSRTIDAGLKYRYFNVPKVRYDGDGRAGPFELDGEWESHSLLASLIFNGVAPPPPPPPVVVAPPPPPPAPATQVCPDGTVILATDVCPPPPPPPPVQGERG